MIKMDLKEIKVKLKNVIEELHCNLVCNEVLAEQLFDVVVQLEDVGNLSDGYHTFNELYEHRVVLFSIICNQNPWLSWKSKKHEDGSMFEGFFIVGINTNQGQYTYHYRLEYWDLFKVQVLDNAPKYDGHKSSDITRLFSILGG
jgi:hypothetical protein